MLISDWVSDFGSSDLKVRLQYVGPAPLEGGETGLAAANGPEHENPSAAPRAVVSAEALPPPPGVKGRSAEVARPATPPPSAMQILSAQNQNKVASADPAAAPAADRAKQKEIGRAHVRNPLTHAHLVCRPQLETKKTTTV